MALTYQRPSSYDVSYVALAEKLQTVAVTADERLLNVVSGQLPYVQPLWDVRLGRDGLHRANEQLVKDPAE